MVRSISKMKKKPQHEKTLLNWLKPTQGNQTQNNYQVNSVGYEKLAMKRIHIGLIGRERDKQDGIVEKKKLPSPPKWRKKLSNCRTSRTNTRLWLSPVFRDMVTASWYKTKATPRWFLPCKLILQRSFQPIFPEQPYSFTFDCLAAACLIGLNSLRCKIYRWPLNFEICSSFTICT
jgi:hypothetical protein